MSTKRRKKLLRIVVDYGANEIKFVREIEGTTKRVINHYWLDDYVCESVIDKLVNSHKYMLEVTSTRLIIHNNV